MSTQYKKIDISFFFLYVFHRFQKCQPPKILYMRIKIEKKTNFSLLIALFLLMIFWKKKLGVQ